VKSEILFGVERRKTYDKLRDRKKKGTIIGGCGRSEERGMKKKTEASHGEKKCNKVSRLGLTSRVGLLLKK